MKKKYKIMNGGFKGNYTGVELISLAKVSVKFARKYGYEKVIKGKDITNVSRAIEYLSNDNLNYKIKNNHTNKIVRR